MVVHFSTPGWVFEFGIYGSNELACCDSFFLGQRSIFLFYYTWFCVAREFVSRSYQANPWLL